MFNPHEYKDSVKAYLLGDLDETNTDSIEKLYFSDQTFFDWVGQMEEQLIADYLKGRLTKTEREHFEERYLKVPSKNRRFEEVKERLEAVPKAPFPIRWEVMALTIVVLCSGVAFWLWPRGEGVSVPAPSAPAETASTPRGGSSRALLSVRLTPGLGKNTVPPRAQVSPPPGGRVSLMFELPGVHSPTDCQIFLTLAGSGSSRNTAWFSDPVTSRASSAGQEVRVEVPSSRFSKADYVAEVRSPRGEVLETYAFRVSR